MSALFYKSNHYLHQLIELEAESAFGLPKNLNDSDDSGVDSD